MSEFLTVRGRGKRLVAKASTMENTAVIRVDDEWNDEFWLEVHLDRELVENLLRQMDAEKRAAEEEVLAVEAIEEQGAQAAVGFDSRLSFFAQL